MRALTWALWIWAAVLIVLAMFGAENFQELYGGTLGVQFFLLALVTAGLPALLDLWAYRRFMRRDAGT